MPGIAQSKAFPGLVRKALELFRSRQTRAHVINWLKGQGIEGKPATKVIAQAGAEIAADAFSTGVSPMVLERHLCELLGCKTRWARELMKRGRNILKRHTSSSPDDLRAQAGAMYLRIIADVGEPEKDGKPGRKASPHSARVKAIDGYCRLYGLNRERPMATGLTAEGFLHEIVEIVEGRKSIQIADASFIAERLAKCLPPPDDPNAALDAALSAGGGMPVDIIDVEAVNVVSP